MTTNAGADQLSKRGIGFTGGRGQGDSKEAINRTFSPEFRNRLDATIQFNRLSEESIQHVVDKFVVELEQQMEKKGVELEVAKDAREWLAKHGHDPAMGARPMGRLLSEKIKRPLAEELLFGQLEHGGKVTVVVKEGEIAFEFPS